MYDEVPSWAMDLQDSIARISTRLSRIEGGLVLAGFAIVSLLAAINAGIVK